MMMSLRSCACAAILAVAACGQAGDGYPALLPTDRILAEPALPGHAAVDGTGGSPAAAQTAAEARATALRRRAEALRGPVIESAARDRIDAASRP